MPNGASRVEVALQYGGKPWGTVQVDLARRESDGTEVEMVDAISLAPFGLQGRDTLPCIALPYHVAQKIHAMTLPPPEGRRNERFRDLVDLLLMRELVEDREAVRTACQRVFVNRGTHTWPPFFDPPTHWEGPYQQMAAELGLPIVDLYQAAIEMRHFIYTVDETAPLFAQVSLDSSISATTWYFAIGPDLAVHRIPAHLGDALCTRERLDDVTVPTRWQREPGGVAFVGVLILLQNRRPIYVERARTEARALTAGLHGKGVYFTPEVWMAVAEEIIRLAKAPRRGVQPLAVLLSSYNKPLLPCHIAPHLGVTARRAHELYPGQGVLWDLRNGRPVQPTK